ncbi:MAG: glycoside hydrolase family 2 protein [Anaerolineae bacterium]
MDILTLNGNWEFSQANAETWLSATVPGCVHTDLLAAGEIPDPYFRDNELKLQWIGEKDWVYRKTFEIPAKFLQQQKLTLRCNSLDTLATIELNGQQLGTADNQFRAWEFDVKDAIQAGENELVITFASALNYTLSKNSERYLHAWNSSVGVPYIRKSQCNFGWDWGPSFITCGILQDIELIGLDLAHISDVHVTQTHGEQVQLDIAIEAETVGDTLVAAEIEVWLGEESIDNFGSTLIDGKTDLTVTIDDPQLWWPNGLGDQTLYRVDVTLHTADKTLDSWSRNIGLRELKLIRQPDEWGESFHFECNGVPFFSKGANWIPADTFVTRVDKAWYKDLLQSAADANMNMLRIWGGGIYEPDIFYDLCDQLGICIWQDFMFACAAYPADDDAFMANFEAEAEQQIKRLRHHASMALWCGNNEMEQGLVADEWSDRAMSWQDYSRLFDVRLRAIVNQLDPQTDYWPGSPHSPHGNRLTHNHPDWGDAHIWDVWHGMEPFEFYRTCMHRFNSEFGFQSFPEPATLDTVLLPKDKNVTSFVMEQHQKNDAGNSKIMSYMLDWFRLPSSFESTIWLSQIQQGMAIKYAVEHWRRTMPRGMGTLYWQLNDCWPVASWSSLDSLGKWKALHYMAKDFFAPTLLSAVEDLDAGTLKIHLTHDLPRPLNGTVRWEVLTAEEGQVVRQGSLDCQVGSVESRLVTTLDIQPDIAKYGVRNLFVRIRLSVGGEVVSENVTYLSRPKHIKLKRPTITAQVEKSGNMATIQLQTDRPAMWVWLEIDGSAHRFSSNFTHLFPRDSVEISLETELSAEALQAKLVVASLWDTFE